MARKMKKSTLDKFTEAKNGYEKGIYKTVEEAAEAHDICPATYYNYQKRVVGDQNLVPKIDLKKELVSDLSSQINSLQDGFIDRVVDRLIERIFLKN